SSTEMAQQTGTVDCVERVVGVESDAPVRVELRAIMLALMQVDRAQDTVAAAVVFIQHKGPACADECGIEFFRCASRLPLDISRQGHVCVTYCILWIQADRLLEQAASCGIVLVTS